MASYNVELRKRTGSTYGDVVKVATDWSLIANKPSTFTPTAHTHDADKVNSLFETVTADQYTQNLIKNTTYYVNTTSNRTFYIDAESEGGDFEVGDQITIIKGSTGYVRFSNSGATVYRTIDGTPGSGTCYIAGRYQAVTLIKTGTNAWIVIGALSSTAVY